MDVKKCIKCEVDKTISEYSKNKNYADGHSTLCKECDKKRAAKWREENRERLREYHRLSNVERKSRFDYSDPFYKETKRICSRCGVEKILLDFSKDAKGTYGIKAHCNECRRPYYGNIKNEFYDPSVYYITHRVTGECLYVGETEVPELRKKNHFCGYGNSPIANQISLGELSEDVLLFEIIERVEERNKRIERETYWIREKKPKYNIRQMGNRGEE